MSTFNIRKMIKNATVSCGLMLAAFFAFSFIGNGVKAAGTGNANLVSIYDKTGGNYNVYIPKNAVTDGTAVAGTPKTCEIDYWNAACNSREAINTKSFTMYVMVPSTVASGEAVQQWSANITYFQYAVVYDEGGSSTPFATDDGKHLDSTLYPLAVSNTDWIKMTNAGIGGMNVAYESKYGAITDEGRYKIYIRYRQEGSDEVGITDGTFEYYTSMDNLNSTTITRAKIGATKDPYNLTATFADMMVGDGSDVRSTVERVAWAEGTKTISDFDSDFYFKTGTEATDNAHLPDTNTTDAYQVSKNVTYTFYIQDRAGNRKIVTHTVDNIFAVVSVSVTEALLKQNLTNKDIYIDANRTVVATGSAENLYKALSDVTFTAVVKDSSNNSAAASYISWSITNNAKGANGTEASASESYTYKWVKTTNVYGTWTITAKAGDLTIGTKTLVVVPVLTVTPTTDKTSYVYGTTPTINYSYSGWGKPSSSNNVDDATILKTKGNTYDWATMKNVDNGKDHTFAAIGFTTQYNEYVFDYKTVSFKVTQQPLTITYKGGEKTYDGDYYNPNASTADDVIAKYTITGLVYGETLATITANFTATQIKNVQAGNYSVEATGATINTTSKNGELTASNATLANYSITDVAGTYTIYPIKVHATFKTQTHEYKQAKFASSIFTEPGNYEITYKNNSDVTVNMPSGESITGFGYSIDGAANFEPEDVGTYKVKATSLTINSGEGLASNYALTSTDGDFVITKKVLTVKFLNETINYDGTSYTDKLTALAKYEFNVTTNQLADWKNEEGASVTFKITFACHSGVVTASTCSAITTAKSPTSSDLKYAGVYTIIPVSVNNVPESISKNYDLTIKATNGTFTINRINLTIAYNADSKVYDGASVSFGTQLQYTFTGLVDADPQSGVSAVAYTIDGSTETQSVVDVGKYMVAPTNATFTARDSYNLTTKTSDYYEITRRTASIAYNGGSSVEYSNTVYTFKEIGKYTISGFVTGEGPSSIAYSVKVGGADKDKVVDAHTYTITPLASSTFGAKFKPTNYNVTYTGGTFEIYKRNITLTVTTTTLDYKNAEYKFDTADKYTIGGSKLATGETITSVAYTVKNEAETEVKVPLLVGKYRVIPDSFEVGGTPNGTAGFDNYDLTGTTTTIEIITVKIDIAACTVNITTKIYDKTTGLPTGFKMICSGAAGGAGNIEVTTGSGSGYDLATVDATKILIKNATLKDNNFEWKSGVDDREYAAEITARPVALSEMKPTSTKGFKKEYDGTTAASPAVYSLDYSVTTGQTDKGFITGDDDLGLTFTANYESANRCAQIDPKTCTKTTKILVTNAEITNKNYKLEGTTREDSVGEITPKAAKIIVNDITSIKYGSVATITYSYEGFIDDQNKTAVTGLKNDYKNTENGDEHRNVGTHTITPSITYANYDNYTVSFETGDVTVVAHEITITYTQAEADQYDGTNKDKDALFQTASHYTVIPDKLPYGEELDSVLTYKLEYRAKNTDAFAAATNVYAAGEYRVTVETFKIKGGNAKATNYLLQSSDGIHKVDPRTLEITFNSSYVGSTVNYADVDYDVKAKDYYTTNLLLDSEKETWRNSNVTIKYTFVRKVGGTAQTDTHIRNYGTYEITPIGYEGTMPSDIYNNYNVVNMTQAHYKMGTFTVNKIGATVTFNANQSATYNGIHKDFTEYKTANYTVTGMVGNDLASLTSVAYDVTYPAGKTKIRDAGTYYITPKDVTITTDAVYGDIKQNYTFTYTENTSYVINPYALTMTTTTNTFFTIGGTKEKVFDDTTDASNLTITYITQITNEDGTEETKAYIGLNYTWAYNSKNVSEATSIIVSGISVTDPNYTITPATLTFSSCTITPVTDAKIITLLNGVQTTKSYTYGTEAVVTFLYEGFWYDGRELSTTDAEDQAKAAAQVKNLAHDYYPSTTKTLRDVGTHTVVGKNATNDYDNYTFAATNYQSANVVVNPMVLTIKYNGNTSIYNSLAVSTDFFTKPEHYTITGQGTYTTNNVLPYSESVSAIPTYLINTTENGVVQNVGKYTVKALTVTITGGNAKATNYTVSGVTDPTTIYEVTKQPITFKFVNDVKPYKSAEYVLSSIELYTLTNLEVMPDSDRQKIWNLSSGAPTVDYSVTRKVGGTAKGDSKAINYGIYTITINKIDNLSQHIIDNYDVKFDHTGTFQITQIDVTVTFVTASKTYDSVVVDLSSPALYTIKVADNTNAAGSVALLGSDTLTKIAYTPTSEIKRANTYSIKSTGMTVASAYETDNYVFHSGDAVDYVINQRELVLNDFTVNNDLIKVYDGNTTTDVTLTPNAAAGNKGLISGENPGFTYDIAYEDKNVKGTGQSVIKITNAAVSNPDYKISSETRDLTGATINKATLDISGQNIYNKNFDNNTTMFAKSNVEVTTGIGTETLKISWTDITNAFENVKYGQDKVVTIPVDKITLANGNNGGLASNYQFVEPTNKAKATINGITYDITGNNCTININYKTYDGNTEAKAAIGFKITCSGATYHVADFELNYTAASFESKDAKGIKASNNITASGFTIADSKYIEDYGFKLSATTRTFEGHINPKTLNIEKFTTSAASTFTKTYDGNTDSAVVLTPTGYITGENVGYTQTAKYDTPTAGENKTITISAAVSNKNYCFSNSTETTPTYTATRTLTGSITKKSLTIVVMLDKTDDTTDVAANVITVEYGTKITVSYDYVDGFIPGENTSALNLTALTNTYITEDGVNTMKNVNSTGYTITASGATATNYAITYRSGTLKITPFEVTLTPIARTIQYTDSSATDMKTVGTAYNLSRTLPYNETLSGELVTENYDKFKYDATHKRYVGEYKVLQGSITNAKNTNYDITYSSTAVNLTVDDKVKPTIIEVTYKDKSNNAYTPGNTATSGLTFTVKATDEAYTLNENAFNLKVTLTVCAGNDTKCTTVVTAESVFDKIATTKVEGGNTFEKLDIARNGTYTYVFKVYDSKSNVVATASTVLVRYLAPVFDKITDPATQQTVSFAIEGYESFLNGRTATWEYFFSRTVVDPTATDFGYHGVELSSISGSTYTTFAMTSGTLKASAKTPLGLKGDYRMLLELKVGGETIYYTQPDAFNIYIATQASQAMYLSAPYTLGDGSNYEGTMTSNGNTLAVINTDANKPSLMAYTNSNGQIVTKFDNAGEVIWSIDLGAYGIYAEKVVDLNEESIVVGTAKTIKFAQLGIVEEFDDREVVVVRIGENGEIKAVNWIENSGNDSAVAVSTFEGKYAVVIKATSGLLVASYSDLDELLWTTVINGNVDVKDIAFDNEYVVLVGTTYTNQYYVNGKKVIVNYRNNGDAFLITLKPDGAYYQIRTLGSSLAEEYVDVEVYGEYIYVLGNSKATMLYNSYGATVISTGKGGTEGFVAQYAKRNMKVEKATFIGGEGEEVHTSLVVNEHGFTVVGTTDSKEELKVSGISGNYISLPKYDGTLTLVYEYDNKMILSRIGYFQGNGVSISEVGYDVDGKLMLMSSGSSLSLMVERKFSLEDINVVVKGKTGYVSIVGDYTDIVITKDGNVISNTSEFIIDDNATYEVTVTDNTGRMVTKSVTVTSFIDASGTVKTDTNNAIYTIGFIAGIIMLFYVVSLVKSRKNEKEKRV